MSTNEDDNDDSKMPASEVPAKVSPPVFENSNSNKCLRRSIKRKKTDPTAASADMDHHHHHQITKLLQCISRGHLESIIATSIQTSTAVTVENLNQALPVEMQWIAAAAASSSASSTTQVVVKPGPSRIGTGLFDDLDDSIVGKILMALPIQERVLCATKVCKSWREFKTFPGLWNDLTAFWRPSSAQKESYEIPAEWVLQLLNWVPAPQDIRAIIIPSTKSCNPKAVNAILKKLVALKTSKGAPPLSGLVLSGPKISPAVFNKIMDGPLIGPGLTSFTLTESVKEGPLADLVPSLLEKCPNLSNICLPPNVLLRRNGNINNAGVGGCLISRLSSARGNNPTILQVLDISCTDYCFGNTNHVSVDLLSTLAKTCPELQVLKTAKLSGIPLLRFPNANANPNSIAQQYASSISTAAFLATPMQPMPRLKTFLVKILRDHEHYVSSASVQQLLPWLFAGMPTLQDLNIGGGHYHISKKDQKEKGIRYPPYPSIGQHALMNLPLTVKRISFSFLMVEPADLEPLMTHNNRFNQLEHVELYACGPRTLDAVVALNTRRHSQLLVSVRTHLKGFHFGLTDPMRAAGIYGVVRLSSMIHSSFVPLATEDAQAPAVDGTSI